MLIGKRYHRTGGESCGHGSRRTIGCDRSRAVYAPAFSRSGRTYVTAAIVACVDHQAFASELDEKQAVKLGVSPGPMSGMWT